MSSRRSTRTSTSDRVESEYEAELEDEYEDEYEDEDEAFLGGLAKIAGSLLGEEEYEFEAESEEEYFFKRIGRALRKVPWRKVIKIAGPLARDRRRRSGRRACWPRRHLAARGRVRGRARGRAGGHGHRAGHRRRRPRRSTSPHAPPRPSPSPRRRPSSARPSRWRSARASVASCSTCCRSLLRGASVLTRVLHRSPVTRQGVRLVPGIVGSTAAHAGPAQRVRPAGHPGRRRHGARASTARGCWPTRAGSAPSPAGTRAAWPTSTVGTAAAYAGVAGYRGGYRTGTTGPDTARPAYSPRTRSHRPLTTVIRRSPAQPRAHRCAPGPGSSGLVRASSGSSPRSGCPPAAAGRPARSRSSAT